MYMVNAVSPYTGSIQGSVFMQNLHENQEFCAPNTCYCICVHQLLLKRGTSEQ